MTDSPDMRPVLSFLAGLRQNNSKPWFEAHRAEYERARTNFEGLVALLIADLNTIDDLGGVTPRDCIFRIHRDVRFSKDKAPYKTNLGAHIMPGGKKSGRLGYYLHIAPGASMAAGGMHMPEAGHLARFRQAIDRDARPFKKILASAPFKRTFGALEGERLKTAPQGYDRDHPEIDLLRLKQVVVSHAFPDAAVRSAGFRREAFRAFKALKPFLDYLNGLIG